MHRSLPGLVAAVLLSAVAARAQQLTPGAEVEIPFDAAVVGGSLYATFTGDNAPPTLVIRLPDDYVPGRAYPLLVYVPGLHGSRAGNIGNAETIAGQRSWIVASLPLFKVGVDASEVGQGIMVGIEDYPAIARAYATMLGRLFELVPNIDRRRSGMVGYSNGALTLAVLLSSHVLSEVELVCDRIGLIRAGRLFRLGTLEELREVRVHRIEAVVSGHLEASSLTRLPGG